MDREFYTENPTILSVFDYIIHNVFFLEFMLDTAVSLGLSIIVSRAVGPR